MLSGGVKCIGSLVGVSLSALWALWPGWPPCFLPVGFLLFGTFFLKGRADEGSEEFSKFVLSFFSSFLFVPLRRATSFSAISALLRLDSFSAVREETCDLRSSTSAKRFLFSCSSELILSRWNLRDSEFFRSRVFIVFSRYRIRLSRASFSSLGKRTDACFWSRLFSARREISSRRCISWASWRVILFLLLIKVKNWYDRFLS